QNGTMVHQVQARAKGLDDVRMVSRRMSLALHSRTSLGDTQTVHTVTATESEVGHRVGTRKHLGVKTQFVMPFSSLPDSSLLGLSFNGRIEMAPLVIEFGAGFLIPSTFDSAPLSGLTLDLGANYYLSDTSVTPYLGVGISPRVRFGGEEAI